MNERFALAFRRAMYNLRGGFLVRPLTIALALGFAGAALSWMEEEVPGISLWMPKLLFPSHADPQVAQVLLGGIAASIMTVVSIVFAILLMTLTLASMQFSPRIILSFTRDRVTQWTLGIFLGTFSYCMAALPAARSVPKPFAPVATVLGAMLLAVACVCWLLFFIHHIAQAISVNGIVDKIAAETEAMIEETMPWPRGRDHVAGDDPLHQYSFATTVLSKGSGYHSLHRHKTFGGHREVLPCQTSRPSASGSLRSLGCPLLAVSKAERLPPEGIAAVRGAFDLGPSRTLQQDVEFGVLQIVDIALKAISPAVNDPSTTISCVDQLSRILIRFASREPRESLFYDPPGVFRVGIAWIDFEKLLDSAFEQIRMYSKNDVAVSLRMMRALGDIATTTPDPDYRRILLRRGQRVVSGCSETAFHEFLML